MEPGERIPWLREQKSEDRACSKVYMFCKEENINRSKRKSRNEV